jgi:hypothetical protein
MEAGMVAGMPCLVSKYSNIWCHFIIIYGIGIHDDTIYGKLFINLQNIPVYWISIYIYSHIIYIDIPVPHQAVAEVSMIGNYRRGELLWCMDGRANPLMDRKVVGVSGYLSVYLSIFLSVYLSICLSLSLSGYLSIYLSVLEWRRSEVVINLSL